MDFDEGPERRALREAVADLGAKYGQRYFLDQARTGGSTTELWTEAGRLGFLGVNLPEEYGGGGGGLGELSLVLEELGAAGCPLLMMVVSPAICGTVIARFGTDDQKTRWLPGLADGSATMAFAITEPDAGSNSHRITTVARRDEDTAEAGWRLTGRKVWISGIDLADHVLVVGRLADGGTGMLRPALFVVPTDSDPIGAHQGLAHPLAQCQVEIELAALMTQKAAWLIDQGQDDAAGTAANTAKFAAAEAAVRTVDQAIQTFGGNGLSQEYGVAALLAMSRVSRIAPVSREMILSFTAQHSLRLPRSY